MKSVTIERIDILTTMHDRITLLNLQTSSGIIGHTCVAQTPILTQAILEEIEIHYLGLPLSNLRFACRQLQALGDGGLISEVITALEYGLWDIFGKQTGLSVNMLLGGMHDQSVLACQNFQITDQEYNPEAIQNAQQAHFRAIRFENTSVREKNELKESLVSDIRRLVKPEDLLSWRLGKNIQQNMKLAKRYADLLFDYQIDCMEVQWPYVAIEQYQQLQQYARIKIAPAFGPSNLQEGMALLTHRAIDELTLNSLYCGGLDSALQLVRCAEMFDIKIALLSTKDPASFLGNLHLASTTSQLAHMDFDLSEIKLKSWIENYSVLNTKGQLTVPSIPGLGLFKESRTGFPCFGDKRSIQ